MKPDWSLYWLDPELSETTPPLPPPPPPPLIVTSPPTPEEPEALPPVRTRSPACPSPSRSPAATRTPPARVEGGLAKVKERRPPWATVPPLLWLAPKEKLSSAQTRSSRPSRLTSPMAS